MDLPKRTLGLSTLEITTVGLGTWAIGGGDWAFAWGPQDDAQSLKTMRHAIDLGINWIDTAAVYGLGHSEEIIGKFLHELSLSERPLVFTKCGVVWDDADRMKPGKRQLTPSSIRKECEASLHRLGVERIDLYQFHWPDESGTRIEDSWATMSQLIGEGKVRLAGVCNFSADLMARCEPIHHVDSLQPPFSLIRRQVAGKEIPWCAEHKTGVIGYSPMLSGLLTETFFADRVAKLPKDDWRARAEEFQQPKLGKNLSLRDALRPIARRYGASVSDVAIAWTLAWPGVTGSIVGARSPEQVDGWIRAASLQLTNADLAEIAAALERTGAGAGPLSPPKSSGASESPESVARKASH